MAVGIKPYERAPKGTQLPKRLFDVAVGAILALLAAPLIVLSAIVAALALRTIRPFFVQDRVGLHGRRFKLVKIRTLPLWAASHADKYAIAGIPLPWICKVLRASHLDELPQLFLVVTGRMSLVGPRPEMPNLLETFDAEFVATRSLVRPGCTGLWQISEAAGGLIGEAPEYDLYYLARGGIRLDLWILARTVRNFLPDAPLIALASVPQSAQSRGLIDEELVRGMLDERLATAV